MSPMTFSLDRRDVDLLVFDFDGVLTDNRVLVFADGTEAVWCTRADGLAFDAFRRNAIKTIILSTEKHAVVAVRATKLQVEAITGCGDKAAALEALCRERGLRLDRVVYIGNDLNDLGVMRRVGTPVAVADAHSKIREIARLTLAARGGEGAAREIAEHVLGLDMGA